MSIMDIIFAIIFVFWMYTLFRIIKKTTEVPKEYFPTREMVTNYLCPNENCGKLCRSFEKGDFVQKEIVCPHCESKKALITGIYYVTPEEIKAKKNKQVRKWI